MGNSISDDNFEGNSSKFMKSSRKRKIDLTLKIFENPLSFEVIKTQILTELQTFFQDNLLQDYYMTLKKFAQNYNKNKFETFLKRFIEFILEEKLGMEQSKPPTTSTSPSTADWLEQDFQLDENLEQVKSAKSSQELCFSPLMKRVELMKKIMKFVELEMAKKDNFFFEFTEIFGVLFATKYQSHIKNFNKALKSFETLGINDGDNAESKVNVMEKFKVKQEIKKKYTEAKQDLKSFKNLLQGFFHNLMTKICADVLKDETLLLQRKDLEKLSLKLLFGKNKCYPIYFELIRLNLIEEENLLKKTLSQLKNLGPEKFRIDQKFCLMEEANPYQHIIDSLNYLNVYTNPIDKFEVISEVRQEILKATKCYYGHESRKNSAKLIELTADDLMSIYCYCLVSSSNEKVKRHQVFIEDFLCDNSMKFGEKAYYFSTFIGAVDFLISIAEDPLKTLEELD